MVTSDWTKVQLRALGKVLRVSTVSGERDYQKSRLTMGIRWTTTGVNTALLISLSLDLRSNGCWRKRNRRGIARMSVRWNVIDDGVRREQTQGN